MRTIISDAMNRSATAPELSPRYRFAAALLALIWCTAPALSAVHATLEVHRYCADHGTVEEVPQGRPTAGEPAVVAPGQPVGKIGKIVEIAGTEDLDAGHDECVFGSFCRYGSLAPMDAPGAAQLVFAEL